MKKITKEKVSFVSNTVLLENFRIFLRGLKQGAKIDFWWKKVFTEPYPSNKPRILIELRIEYELEKRAMEEQEKDIPARFMNNYLASVSMKQEKFTPSLLGVIRAYEKTEKKKAETELLPVRETLVLPPKKDKIARREGSRFSLAGNSKKKILIPVKKVKKR